MKIALGIVQILLALVFFASGFMKLFPFDEFVASAPALTDQRGLVTFIGIAEVAGALGLILPALRKFIRFSRRGPPLGSRQSWSWQLAFISTVARFPTPWSRLSSWRSPPLSSSDGFSKVPSSGRLIDRLSHECFGLRQASFFSGGTRHRC